jgi:NAD(P)-dependent dehydrogenase (short-subunit alcohol dehydrogenase family)
MSFANKVILITGGSAGIGAELARQLAPEKPRLVLAARRMDALQAVVAQCEASGAEAHAVRCDVREEADCKALAISAIVRFGSIDVLVNNAGIAGHGRLEDVSDFAWYEEMMRVNYMGTVLCTRYALAELRKSKGLVVDSGYNGQGRRARAHGVDRVEVRPSRLSRSASDGTRWHGRGRDRGISRLGRHRHPKARLRSRRQTLQRFLAGRKPRHAGRGMCSADHRGDARTQARAADDAARQARSLAEVVRSRDRPEHGESRREDGVVVGCWG